MRSYLGKEVALEFVVEDNMPALSDDNFKKIRRHWQQVASGTNMFPGGIWCAHEVAKADGQVVVKVNRTDYSVYKYFRDEGIELPGVYSMGTGILVYDKAAEAFVFAVRTDKVGFDRGKISVFGGVVDWDSADPEYQVPDDAQFMDMVAGQAKKELAEELRCDEQGNLEYIEAYVDEKTLKVEFLFEVEARNVRLSGDEENLRLVLVKKEELKEFVENNRDRLEASTRGHLEHMVGLV